MKGASEAWHGRLVCLGTEGNSEPIFTMTSALPHKPTMPTADYMELIRVALLEEGHFAPDEVDQYLRRMSPPVRRVRQRRNNA